MSLQTKNKIIIINEKNVQNTACSSGCGECQTSCQSACKTSCTVANQNCEHKKN